LASGNWRLYKLESGEILFYEYVSFSTNSCYRDIFNIRLNVVFLIELSNLLRSQDT